MGDAIREVEDNAEATEAWNGPLFDVWVEFRGIVAWGVAGHGEAARPGWSGISIARKPPASSWRASSSHDF